ncbi:MAG: dockerin type I domain-containing protein [Verrucomicrobiota bacterium]
MKKNSTSLSGFFNRRFLISLVFFISGAFLALAGFGQGKRDKQSAAQWPSLSQALSQDYSGYKVQSGTELEKLVRASQDFSSLRDDEKTDKRGLPAWLRVWWRKAHPEVNYTVTDPTGGYPHVLKEILEWMLTHQDLKAGPGIESKSGMHAAADPDGDTPSIGADLRISGVQSAARSESDIRINYFDPMKIISASNNIAASGKQAIYYSVDGGVNWNQTTLPGTGTDTSHSDPTCDWTSDGRAWSSTLGIVGSSLRLRNYYSLDNGATWTFEGTASGTQTNVDKQMVWVDHSASSPFQNQMYAIWHNGNPAFMNRRTAGAGGTWLASPIQVSGVESSGTCIGGDVKTNGAGDVFGSWPSTVNSKIFVVKSTNGGASFGAPVQVATTFDSYDIGVPSFNNRRALIYVTLGAYKTALKDNVYATWTDLSGEAGCTVPNNEPGSNVNSTCKTRVWFSRSIDGGATWAPPVKINNQASLNDQYNQWLAVDETSGGIGIMYYDTVSDAGRKKTEIWYQSSADDGGSWSPAQKVATGMTDETAGGQDSGNQYGDYNGMSAFSNTFFPSWTDRRSLAREEIWTAKITDTFAPAANIVSSGSTVVAGTCGNPAVINPGAMITVDFCVQDNGGLATTNLVGTLQASGGVSNPSGPQSYGVVTPGGGSVCRSFTFNTSAACGGSVTAAVQFQDGANNLGTRTYNFTMAGTPNVLYTENFDGASAPALPPTWVASNASGTTLWVTSATTPDSSPNDAFVDDPATVSDKRLDSAPISITSATAQLTFRNSYNLEAGSAFYDGGVLEISSPNINGGAFTDITNAAVGGSFSSGGYAGTISSGFSNPLAGRQAWSGNSGGYITTVANLGPNVAGQTIKLRFRMGSDNTSSATGWRIDSLSLNDGFTCAPVPVSAVSRKMHGGVNTFDVDLPLSGVPGIESRSGGPTGDHQVIVTFANPVAVSGASVTAGSGSAGSYSVNGSQVTVNLTGVTNGQTIWISLDSVNDGTNMGCIAIPMSVLVGDTNGNGSVNSSDVSQTKSRIGQLIDVTNFRSDVNVNGSINATDVAQVKANIGSALP